MPVTVRVSPLRIFTVLMRLKFVLMDFVKFFHNWFFNDYQDVVTWIMYGGAAWTVVIFVFNVIFSIILDFVKGDKR